MIPKLKKLIILLLCLGIICSCSLIKKRDDWDKPETKKNFTATYRDSFFCKYLSLATQKKIIGILDSLNDWSYQGDGGYVPPAYWGRIDSAAKTYFERADRIVFNPGEAPRTCFISELEMATRKGGFLDSAAKATYRDYRKWFRNQRREEKKKVTQQK